MQPFYFTFGVGQEYAKHYVEIVAPDAETARAVMERMHGLRWSFQYTATAFEGFIEKYGYRKLATVRLHDNGAYYADHPRNFSIAPVADA